MKKNIACLIFCSLIYACKSSSEEKHYNPNRYTYRLKPEQIKESPLSISVGHPALFYQNNNLWMVDFKAYSERAIYILTGDSYERASVFLRIGKGPGEIVRPGELVVSDNLLLINDYGRSCLCSYRIDSLISNPEYKNASELVFKNYLLGQMFFINDSTVIARAIHPLSISSYECKLVTANLHTAEIRPWGYEHPDATGEYVSYSSLVQLNNGCFARCYINIDLITLLNPDGSLKCNIYGPYFGKKALGEYDYCHDICAYKDYFLVSYVGEESDIIDSNGRSRGNLPSRVLVFDNSGNHLATIEFGEKFNRMAVDEQKQRLVFTFYEREAMLGYIDLEPIFRTIRNPQGKS